MALGLFSSLRARLLAIASLVVFIFAAVAVAVLYNAFEQAARDSVREQLNAQLYALLTAAEVDAEGDIYFPERLVEPRFSVAGSGLYAFAYDTEGGNVWRSPSAISPLVEPSAYAMPVGSTRFGLERSEGGTDLFTLRFGVAWESAEGQQHGFTIVVAEDLVRYHAQVDNFRRNLFLWSAAGVGLLMALQLSILHWALRPLSRVGREIDRVERGDQRLVEGAYPDEIRGLTRNINRLIESSQRSLERYRNSLGDLAHSLKTPLAVLRGLTEEDGDAVRAKATLAEQVRRMADIVDYQLKRAASSGGRVNVPPIAVGPVVDKVVRTLGKVYSERSVDIAVDVEQGLAVPMDEGDLMEILGNVIENACKWTAGKVRVRAHRGPRGVELSVVDDGPGIEPALARDVLRRGVRADERIPGQGIGLSIVRDIVESYDGEIEIGKAAAGGADVRVVIPAR